MITTIITNIFICHIIEPYVLYKYAFKSNVKGYYLRNYLYIAVFCAALLLSHKLNEVINSNDDRNGFCQFKSVVKKNSYQIIYYAIIAQEKYSAKYKVKGMEKVKVFLNLQFVFAYAHMPDNSRKWRKTQRQHSIRIANYCACLYRFVRMVFDLPNYYGSATVGCDRNNSQKKA